MRLMFAAERAEFLHLNPFRCGLFILRFTVVAVLAFPALKLNDFAWHFLISFPVPSLTPGSP
jgi:hypothetical protein